MAAETNLTVTATAVDEVTGPMKAAAESFARAAAQVANSDQQIAKSAQEVERANKARLSATKQVELAISLEAAAGKPLEQQLIRLQHTYQSLRAQMAALVRDGQPVPTAMLQQAAAAKEGAEKLAKLVDGEKALEGATDSLAARLAPGAMALTALGLAAGAAKQAIDVIAKSIIERAPDVRTLTTEVTRSQSALNALKETADDPAFEGAAGTFARVLTVAYAALNTTMAELERRGGELQREVAARDLATRAAVEAATSGLNREIELEQKWGSLADRNKAKIKELTEKWRERNKLAAQASRETSGRSFEATSAREGIASEMSIEASKHERWLQLEAERTKAHQREVEARKQFEMAAHSEVFRKAQETQRQLGQTAVQVYEMLVSFTQQALQTFGDNIVAVIEHTKDLKTAALDTMRAIARAALQAMIGFVVAKAVEGAASAYKDAIERFGVAGILVGAGAAAVAFAAILALTSKAKGYAKGGVITGGVPGRDSVPIIGMPGERVLTVQQTQAFDRFVGMLDRVMSGAGTASQGGGGGGGGGGDRTVVFRFESAAPPDEAALQRHVIKHLRPSLLELHRDGLLPIGAR
jgi:hypothetical protein